MGHLGLQEPHEVRIPPHGDVVQAQLQRSDDPAQEVYSILKLGLSDVRLAQELPFRPDLPRKPTALSRQDLSELTLRYACVEPALSITPLPHGIEEQISTLQASEKVVKRPATKLLFGHLAIGHISKVEYDPFDGGVV